MKHFILCNFNDFGAAINNCDELLLNAYHTNTEPNDTNISKPLTNDFMRPD